MNLLVSPQLSRLNKPLAAYLANKLLLPVVHSHVRVQQCLLGGPVLASLKRASVHLALMGALVLC